jgi:hypothetical protein
MASDTTQSRITVPAVKGYLSLPGVRPSTTDNLISDNNSSTVITQNVDIPIFLPDCTEDISITTATANLANRIYCDTFTTSGSGTLTIDGLTIIYAKTSITIGAAVSDTSGRISVTATTPPANIQSIVTGYSRDTTSGADGVGTQAGGGSAREQTGGGGTTGVSSNACLVLISNQITINAAINFDGGDAGNITTDSKAAPGGGYGGFLYAVGKTSITHSSGDISCDGGAGGDNTGGGSSRDGGAGGGSGLIQFWAPTITKSGGTRAATVGTGGTGSANNGATGAKIIGLNDTSGYVERTGSLF